MKNGYSINALLLVFLHRNEIFTDVGIVARVVAVVVLVSQNIHPRRHNCEQIIPLGELTCIESQTYGKEGRRVLVG